MKLCNSFRNVNSFGEFLDTDVASLTDHIFMVHCILYMLTYVQNIYMKSNANACILRKLSIIFIMCPFMQDKSNFNKMLSLCFFFTTILFCDILLYSGVNYLKT